MTTDISDALKQQCSEQRTRCLYTSTTLMVWLRILRKIRIAFVVLPIVFGALASWDLIAGNSKYSTITAVLALVAGIIPAVYAALKLDEHLPTASRLAGEYKNLEILFADLERVHSLRPFTDFQTEYDSAIARLTAANSEAYTAPEWCFKAAQKKIESGHYSFTPSGK